MKLSGSICVSIMMEPLRINLNILIEIEIKYIVKVILSLSWDSYDAEMR
jgi:hypothetical protein